jgi:hypothetical protein
MGSSAFGPLLAQAGVNTGKPMNKIAALVCGARNAGETGKRRLQVFCGRDKVLLMMRKIIPMSDVFSLNCQSRQQLRNKLQLLFGCLKLFDESEFVRPVEFINLRLGLNQ